MENPYRIEFPVYKPEPDSEDLLKKLENRFSEKFEQRVREILERMNFESKDLPETLEDMKNHLESDLESVKSKAEDEAEPANETISTDTEALLKELELNPSDELLERTLESMDRDYEKLESELIDQHRREHFEAPGEARAPLNETEQEAIENAPATVVDRIGDDLHEVVDTERVESESHADEEFVSEPNEVKLLDTTPERSSQEATLESIDSLESDLLNDPLILLDIEALYNDLEEEAEPEEEQVESEYY